MTNPLLIGQPSHDEANPSSNGQSYHAVTMSASIKFYLMLRQALTKPLFNIPS
jgi:hypothetical protein